MSLDPTDLLAKTLAESLPFLAESIKGWFGKDQLSNEARDRFARLWREAVFRSSLVQCFGLSRPVPIHDLYQPLRLTSSPYDAEKRSISAAALLPSQRNCIILSRGGGGKTMLMHWLFTQSWKREDCFPLLITLRTPGAIDDLSACLGDIAKRRGPAKSTKYPLLLVDGYDEIAATRRREVS